MKNIPMFTSAYGIATLILREIPWSGCAYVLVRSVWNGQAEDLLEECRGFCRAVGAEAVYASYEEDLPAEHAWDLLVMTRPKAGLPQPSREIELEPVTEENGSAYLEIYNRCFKEVPAAASYGQADLKRLMEEETGWLAKQDGRYAAVAEISREGLEGVAVLPEFRGLGQDLLLTVLPMVPSTELQLKVADTNTRAIALYTRLGFAVIGIHRRWWKL